MKRYNEHTFEKLGFHAVRAEVARHTLSAPARERALAIEPQSNAEWLIPELDRVAELVQIFRFDDPFPLNQLPVVDSILAKARLEGAWLQADDFALLKTWLGTVGDVRTFLKSRKEEYPRLHVHMYQLEFNDQLVKSIDAVIDERGKVRDNASPELVRLRKEQQAAAGELRSSLQRTLRYAQDNKWSEAGELTIRNDRLVIPVKADAKGRIPGFVHDVSSSGNTVFIEPTEALGLNNALRELQLAERNEVIRILQALTAELSAELGKLQGFSEIMVQLDLLRAKAKLALDMEAHKPLIRPKGTTLKLINARYPLLILKARQNPLEIVPLNLELTKEKRILIISGPNAGGKSVSLKTVGLLQLMLQSGMLVPTDPESEFRLFNQLFMDIGDEQSVESDLSTYTSHLYQLRLAGDNLTEDGLFLMDEFGSGTDPQMGGAIAEAFLSRFLRLGGYGIITTHYGNIKDFAARHEGIENGAMAFDMEALAPTYRLEVGLPGRSYAFEIAKRVGVHPTILRKARRKMGKKQLSAEDLLKQLEGKNQELARLVEEQKAADARLKRLVEKNEALQNELRSNRKKLMQEAKIEAKRLIKDANKKIEATIREIRETQADKERTKKLRQELEAATPKVDETKVVESPAPKEKQKAEVLGGEPGTGDWVKLKHGETQGELVEVQGKRGVVVSGGLRLTVKLKDLVRVKPPKAARENASGIRISRSRPQAKVDLDVMGQRAEEALVNVQRHVDDALLAGLPMVRILHGKGSGVLRDTVRSYLRDLPQVESLADAPIEMGGAGWTVVSFR